MNEGALNLKIGDSVYHVEEYHLTNYELRQKGLEGFANYGIEVVNSVITQVESENFTSKASYRDIGNNTNSDFFWKISDYGRTVFATKEEAAIEAENRAHNIQLGYHCSKFDLRPMYKNWLHWDREQIQKKVEKAPESLFKRSKKNNRIYRRKTILSEDVYTAYRDGEITAKVAAERLSVSITTFGKYISEEFKKRGEHHVIISKHKKPLPENFDKVFQLWKCGQLSEKKAAEKCGISHSTFRVAADRKLEEMGEKREKMRKGMVLPENFNDVVEEWEAGNITISEGAKLCGMKYERFKYYAEKMHDRRVKAGVFD